MSSRWRWIRVAWILCGSSLFFAQTLISSTNLSRLFYS
jgi:hypothetical protein